MGKKEKVLEKARDCWKKGRAPCPKAWAHAKGGGQGRGGGGQGTAPPQHPKAPLLPPPPRGAPGPAWPCRAWSCAPWPWSSSSSLPSSSSSASWSPSPPKVTPGPLPGLGLDAVRFWGAHGGDVTPGDAPPGGAAGGVGASPRTSVVDPRGFGVPFTAPSWTR